LGALPDLRQFYQKTSWGALFFLTSHRSEGAVPDLAETLRSLVTKRHGALLVFPQDDDLEQWMTGGETYDARFRKSLLLSLLNPESPRHDGAVVIKGDRLVRVGAVLPLASTEKTPEDWGTRHLAALGLSRRCDAHVLVVSEERGTITHLQDGESHVLLNLSEKDLERELKGIFGSTEETGRFSRRAQLSALLWLGAVVLAGFGSYKLDGVVSTPFGKPAVTTTEDVKVNLVNIPAGLFVDELSAGRCEVLAQIPRETVVLGRLDLAVTIDLKEAKPGLLKIALAKELLNRFPAGGEVFRFEPAHITLTLAEIRQRDLSIKPVLTGLPATLKIQETMVQPVRRAVKIRDVKWKENSVLETVPVDLSILTRAGTYAFTTNLNLPGTITPVEQPENLKTSIVVTVKKKTAVP
jgi:hypothetical protein